MVEPGCLCPAGYIQLVGLLLGQRVDVAFVGCHLCCRARHRQLGAGCQLCCRVRHRQPGAGWLRWGPAARSPVHRNAAPAAVSDTPGPGRAGELGSGHCLALAEGPQGAGNRTSNMDMLIDTYMCSGTPAAAKVTNMFAGERRAGLHRILCWRRCCNGSSARTSVADSAVRHTLPKVYGLVFSSWHVAGPLVHTDAACLSAF